MNRTKVDWYAGRTQASPLGVLEPLKPAFGDLGKWLHMEKRPGGWQGYTNSAAVCIADQPVGLAAWGGGNQRGWMYLSFSGEGCGYVTDWDTAQECFGQLPDWEPRRTDIALDTFQRESSYEAVLQAHAAGGFNLGGRPPRCRWSACNEPSESRKVTIAERTSAKYLRCYEKGLQLAKPQGLTHIDGVAVEDWFRLELECKAKDGPLPVDIIDKRDQYFAGAYPYLQELMKDVQPEILVMTRERMPQMHLADALAGIRRQYGMTLYTALHAYQGDMTAVWDQIIGDKHSQQLLEKGVLLVEHG